MNTDELYQQFIDDTLGDFANCKNMFDGDEFSENLLFDSADTSYVQLHYLQDNWHKYVLSSFVKLTRLIFDQYGQRTNTLEDNPFSHISLEYSDSEGVHVAFFVWPDVQYSSLCRCKGTLNYYAHQLTCTGKVQSTSVVWLTNEDNEKLQERISAWDELFGETNNYHISAIDWYVKNFSADEAEKLKDCAAKLRMESRSIQGLVVVSQASYAELDAFRQKKMNEFTDNDLVEIQQRLNEQHLSSDVLEALFKNVIEKSRYQYLYGTSKAAESFISSEWRLELNEMSEAVEQTGTVAGYIKTIEQMLFQLLEVWSDRGLEASFGPNGPQGLLTEGFIKEHRRKAMLHNLLWLFSSRESSFCNGGIYEVGCDVREVLYQKLIHFNKYTRNGKFHKTNFRDINTVHEIRSEVLDIVFLILGSMKLDKSQEERLFSGVTGGSLFHRRLVDLAREFNKTIKRFEGSEISKAQFLAIDGGKGKWFVEIFIDGPEKSEIGSYYYSDSSGGSVESQKNEVVDLLNAFLSSQCESPMVKTLISEILIKSPGQSMVKVPVKQS